MNLIPLTIEIETNYHCGTHLTHIQQRLYKLFSKAIEEERSLLIPGNLLPRGCGKSTVLKILSSQHSMVVLHNSSLVRYDDQLRENRIRGISVKGTNNKHLLIDEPTTFMNIERAGADFCKLYGFSHELEGRTQSFQSELDIAELKLFIQSSREEGNK